MILTVIGGGSVNWMSALMRDVYLLDEVSGGEIRLVDPHIERVSAVAALLRVFNRERGKDYKISVLNDRREALAGADFVMTTFSPGSLDAFEHDLELPIQYGLRLPVSMTVGIPGISAAIRTAPVAYEIVCDMEAVCPDAWLLNVTNPMSVVTAAMHRAAKRVKVVGLCHEFHAFSDYILPMLGLRKPVDTDLLTLLYQWLPEQGFTYTVAGINHFIWITAATYKGVDALPLIQAFCRQYTSLNHYRREHALEITDAYANSGEVKFALCRQLGYLPVAGDRHLVEFLPSLCNIRNGYGMAYNVRKTTIDERRSYQRDRLADIRAVIGGETAPVWHKSAEEMTEIMRAILTRTPTTAIVNAPNIGQITNLPPGAIVETLATVDHNGVTPTRAGELPGVIGSLCRLHSDVQALTLEAALNGDRRRLIEAMSLDPTAAAIDFAQIPQLADQLLERNRPWLPRFFD